MSFLSCLEIGQTIVISKVRSPQLGLCPAPNPLPPTRLPDHVKKGIQPGLGAGNPGQGGPIRVEEVQSGLEGTTTG